MSIMSDIPKHPIAFLPERVAVQYLTLYSVPSITHETGSVCRAVEDVASLRVIVTVCGMYRMSSS